MLYKVFVDDSGKKEYLNPYSREFIDNALSYSDYPEYWRDNYFVLAGVKVKQSDISEINDQINSLKRSTFGVQQVEIKSDWLRNPHQRKKHYLEPFKITATDLNTFGEKFLDLIAKYQKELKVYGIVFDKRYYGDGKRRSAEGSPLLKTTQILLERIHYSGGYNIVTFDQMESSLKLDRGNHDKMLKVFIQNDGMEQIYVNQYKNIVKIDFKQSSSENFLQMADIVAYNIYRQFVENGKEWCGTRQHEDGSPLLNSYKYFHKIRCNFAFNPLNHQVRGIGLSCVPDTAKINWNLLEECLLR